MTKRKSLTLEELSEDTEKVFAVLNEESDLVCVLIGTSYLDELLASILRAKLIESSITDKLLSPRGPIGSFAARADLAYSLALINKSVYSDLIKIAEIRNRFAHRHLALDFGDAEVRSDCEELQAWRFLEDGDKVVLDDPTSDQLRTRARNLFKLSVVFLGARIHVDAFGHRRKKLEKDSPLHKLAHLLPRNLP